MSLRHKASCVDPQFTASKQNINGTSRVKYSWDRPQGNDATGASLSKEVGLRSIASPQDGQKTKAVQQHAREGPPADVSFAGSYAPLRCRQDSPAVLSLVLQQAMAVADLAQRNLLESEERCTLRSNSIDIIERNGRRGCVHGVVDAATAQRMLEPFHSHMQSMARDNGTNWALCCLRTEHTRGLLLSELWRLCIPGDGASSALLQAYAGGHNPIVLSLKNQPVEVAADALNCLDKV